ncbi:MAG TPA: hypothetical protein VHR72_02490 [Gemmataceae bacterium]|jgi:hypothetical protein|nr:hypothetical protein [Gemmataceae bacterium]
MAKKKKPDDEPIEPIEPLDEGETLDIIVDDDLVVDDSADDVIVDDTEDIVVDDADLVAADDVVETGAGDIEVDDIDLDEIPDAPLEEPVEIDAEELIDSDLEGIPAHAADFDAEAAEESTESADYSSLGDEFSSSLGGDDLDAEPVEAGVTTLPPDAEGPDDTTMPAEPLKPGTHWLTYVLIGLNFIAAPAFGYLMLQRNQRVQDYRYAGYQLELADVGLPTTEEETGAVAARLILPNSKIPSKHIADVMTKRGVNFGSDPVAAIDEQFNRRILAKDLDKRILKEHFETFGQDYLEVDGQPIRTVEQELQRLAKKTVSDIKEAASDSVPAGEKEQRAQIEKLLMPLARNTVQVEKLDKRIAESKDLKGLYIEAAERRMAFAFLLPLEVFRPGDPKDFSLWQIGDLDALKTDEILQHVDDRIASTLKDKYDPKLQLGWVPDPANDPKNRRMERETVEKRLMASFTMLSLAYVKKPSGEKLEPKLLDRIPLVVGQYDAAMAETLFPATINALNEQALEAIKYDRSGYAVKKDDKEMRVQSFSDRYEDLLQQIRFVQQDTLKSKRRLADLEAEKVRLGKLSDERIATRKTILDSIETERAKTDKLNGELRVLQTELFQFERRLATSEEELEGTNAEIQKRFRPTSSPKGGR